MTQLVLRYLDRAEHIKAILGRRYKPLDTELRDGSKRLEGDGLRCTIS